MYEKLIIDHSKNPRNFGELADPSIEVVEENPVCGDLIKLQLRIKNGIIQEIKFSGHGCAISVSSASMMTEATNGKSVATVRTRLSGFNSMLQGDSNVGSLPGDLAVFRVVRKFPVRIKCALLPWSALRRALEMHHEER